MTAALLVKGEVYTSDAGLWHADLLRHYMAKHALSEDETDELIDTGQMRFGHARRGEDGKLSFVGSEFRDENYTCVTVIL